MKPRIVLAVLLVSIGPLYIPFLFWVSGFNFDRRGMDALFCCLLSSIVLVACWVGAFELLIKKDR